MNEDDEKLASMLSLVGKWLATPPADGTREVVHEGADETIYATYYNIDGVPNVHYELLLKAPTEYIEINLVMPKEDDDGED